MKFYLNFFFWYRNSIFTSEFSIQETKISSTIARGELDIHISHYVIVY